jgi:dolichyl-phosphate-mannose--protein O-mannosyl transferase
MYYFMYDSFMKKSYTIEYKHSLMPLLLTGIFFGIGAASKWIGLYAGAGLAFLYFLSRYLEYRDYERAKFGWKKGPARKFVSGSGTNAKEAAPSKKWVSTFIKKNLVQTSLYCILFFIVIPVILYTASYIPIMMTPGNDHGLQDVWNYQTTMYNYHTNLKDTHVYQSPAWSWPFITRPLCFYWGDANDLPAGKVSTITTMGNPAIWWFGIIAFLASLAIAIRKKDKKMVVVFAAMTFQYLPWFLVQRCIFIYHFFSTVPFIILCIVYLWKFILEDSPGIAQKMFAGAQTDLVVGKFARYSMYIYLLLVAALFIWFYPALSGMLVDKSYVDHLRWFPNNWVF